MSRVLRRGRERRTTNTKRKKQEETMSDYISFPEEIVSDILKRLSIEDAVRCTSVCKSWYSLITSPSFISIHSKQIASSTGKDLLLVRDCHSKKPNKELYSLHSDDGGEYKSLDFPIASPRKDMFFRVIGCVNGVVCLSDDIMSYNWIMYLWNPSIKKFLNLPPPIFTFSTHGNFMHTLGFGFDDTTNDFKVVRVVYLMDKQSMVPPMVEVFEPRVGSWREVDAKGFSWFIDEKSPQAFLNGNVHWVIGCKDEYDFFKERNTNNLVVSFDLRSEKFGVMKVPDSLNEPEFRQVFCVSVLGESLSLIHDTSSKYGNTCCIWVMKQYGVPDSWTKLFSIDVRGGFWQVIGFQRNGEALVKAASKYRRNSNLMSFEPKSKQLKTLAEFGKWKSLYVDNFVETLALLGVKGRSMLTHKLFDTGPPNEDSSDSEYERFSEAANPYRPDNVPPVQVLVNWCGSTD